MMISQSYAPVVPQLGIDPEYPDLETSILRTVAYSDVFDYPLKVSEITRYLIGMFATQEEVESALDTGSSKMDLLRFTHGYSTLSGRERLVDLRQKREEAGRRRWPAVQRYARWIAALPFVRMVAVTGALAVNNEAGHDLDFLVVTTTGRVWLCRGLVMLLVRWARRYGDEICPNYFLAESALILAEQNLYTAHEMTQMVPLSGINTYQRMRRLNPWVESYLPNATSAPLRMVPAVAGNGSMTTGRRTIERLLWTAPGNWVENWEMRRKVRKFHLQETAESETSFGQDWCKGHFGGYGKKTKDAYTARLQSLGLFEDLWEL